MLTVDTMQTHTYRIIIYQSTPEPILDNQGFFIMDHAHINSFQVFHHLSEKSNTS